MKTVQSHIEKLNDRIRQVAILQKEIASSLEPIQFNS